MSFGIILLQFSQTRANEDEESDESWNDSCYDAGYDDGQNGPFSEPTWDHCGDEEGGDDAYYDGFIDGCMDVDNSRDVCESATDAGEQNEKRVLDQSGENNYTLYLKDMEYQNLNKAFLKYTISLVDVPDRPVRQDLKHNLFLIKCIREIQSFV